MEIAVEHRKINDEVLYPKDQFPALKGADLEILMAKAAKNPRKRIRFCAHQSPEDKTHEMFIVHGRDAYVRPHRHLKRSESFFLIKGRADAVFFNQKGKVVQKIPLGDIQSGRQFYYRLNKPVFHTLIIKSAAIIFFEVTSGPFSPKETEFASWAPDGKDPQEAWEYMERLAKTLPCA